MSKLFGGKMFELKRDDVAKLGKAGQHIAIVIRRRHLQRRHLKGRDIGLIAIDAGLLVSRAAASASGSSRGGGGVMMLGRGDDIVMTGGGGR